MNKQSWTTLLTRRIAVSLITLSGLACLSCHSLRVYVSDTVPPDFTFGSGTFAECCTDFKIFAVLEEGTDKTLWRIASRKIIERPETHSVVIHYGRVSERFEQEIPESGEPPPLVEGKAYVAVAGGTSYYPWSRVKFTIRNNRIVTLPLKRGELP